MKEGSTVSEVTFHFSKGGKTLGGNYDVIIGDLSEQHNKYI
jgi:hypothetical protein